jgi:hypothetical protein
MEWAKQRGAVGVGNRRRPGRAGRREGAQAHVGLGRPVEPFACCDSSSGGRCEVDGRRGNVLYFVSVTELLFL